MQMVAPSAGLAYLKGWAAVNKLIHTGQSWSGRERNCCFLNLAGGRFADVSAATGLDFIDDARAAARVDWDFDGRVDLWIANRSAPQLRFVRNNVPSDNHFVAFRLRGNGRSVNRDAIGARLELVLAAETARPLIATLRAGDGALSQSTKWVHFGLGRDARIKHLVVRWPDGTREEFSGLTADAHYLVNQGTGKAQKWTPPAERSPLVATTESPPREVGPSRTVVVGRVPAPELTYHDENSRPVTIDAASASSTLVVLWASWCPPCLEELKDLAAGAEQLSSAGLRVVALSVDGLADDAQSGIDNDHSVLRRLEFPFPSGRATAMLVNRLDVLQRGLITQQRPIGVPSSFLIDSSGRIACIYKGRLSVAQLMEDVAMLEADPRALRDLAVPFAGRWHTTPPSGNPMNVVLAMIDSGDLEETASYLKQCRAMYGASATEGSHGGGHRQMADMQYFLGCVLADQGKRTESCEAFRDALRADPSYWIARYDLGKALLRLGRPSEASRELELANRDKPGDADVLNYLAIALGQLGDTARAIEHYRDALEIRPEDANIRYNLALALQTRGDAAAAVEQYRRALVMKPGWTAPANNLAWLLATHPDASIRDGAEAVRLAEPMVEATGRGNPAAWDTLAAAYAEAGQFDRAASAARQALELANSAKNHGLRDQIQLRLHLFQKGQPYREHPQGD